MKPTERRHAVAHRQGRLGIWSSAVMLHLVCVGACQSRQSVDASRPPLAGDESDTSDAGAVADAGTVADGASPFPVTDGGTSPQPLGGGVRPEDGGPGETPGTIVETVANWGEYSALSTPQGELKFLLPQDDASNACWFQDTNVFPFHLQFLRSLPTYSELSAEAYEDMVLTREKRQFQAGVLRLFSGAAHPTTGEAGLLAFTVYTEATRGELLSESELAVTARRLESCLGELAPFLVYLPEGPLALAWAQQNSAALEQSHVAWVEPSELRPSLQGEVYSSGEAYGYIRRATSASLAEVGPRDVVVAETAPGDLGIIAALLTEQVQSSVSHLNLRLREKRIPNAATPKWFESGFFDSLEGTLVHVTTSDAGVTVTPARLQEATEFWETQVPRLPEPQFTLDLEELPSLEALRHDDSDAYGTKAANLGELIRVLPEQHVPRGIAIPFSAYQRHLAHNGLLAAVDEAVSRASVSAPAAASATLADLRSRIKKAEIESAWEGELVQSLVAELGEESLTTRLRFRSSTNVEDLPGLSGAGLYDSASGCLADDLDDDATGPSLCLTDAQAQSYREELERLEAKRAAHPELPELDDLILDVQKELSEEKSARKALRKVWASLWNDRAFQDRQYYGIDHQRVFMGVAVHASLVGERLESVLVSNLEPETAEPLYRMESQAGEVGVVEPQESDAVSERLQFRRSSEDQPTGVALIRASSFAQGGASLWPDAQLEQMARMVFDVQDHFEQHVYPELRPLQLDLEIDVTAEGVVWFKQARPYVSGGW